MSAVAGRCREELAEITELEPQGVTLLEQCDDGTWWAIVELLELSRTPETEDVLGSYAAHLDEGGQLLGYRRVGRHARGQSSARRAGGG